MSTKWRVIGIGLVVAALARQPQGDACGPGFPTNILVRRADALATMWNGSFEEEAVKFVRVSPADRAAFTAPAPDKVTVGAREQQLYSAGAAYFHFGEFAKAGEQFEALLRLPARARAARSVEAAYSLGRARRELGQYARAVAAFRQVRTLVRAGFVDPDRLAVASLGEEAWAEWRLHDNAVAPVHLYAEQAAFGDHLSLLVVAREAGEDTRAELYRDDIGTKLLALYYYTRSGEMSDEDRAVLKRELARQVTTEARGAAYLAAASYRDGAWEQAGKLARLCTHSPIATWVQAKLALRDGDRAKAEALLRTVEHAAPAGNDGNGDVMYTLDDDPRARVRGELGLLALADGRFAEATDWFARGDHSVEASYVAERALSFDELETLVQKTDVVRAAGPKLNENDDPTTVCNDDSIYDEGTPASNHPYCWATRLLKIYARRAIREHHYDAALDAFGPDNEDAHDLVAALTRADAASGIERAEQLFAAAKIMREHGIELAGTEVAPDWAIYDGGYSRTTLCLPTPAHGYTRYANPDDDDFWYDEGEDCVAPSRADAALVSPLEVARVRASAPAIDERYSYRYVASSLAEQGAELVPPRSQAYTALLCWAAHYAHRDQTRVEELYAKAVRNGAADALEGDFAEECDQPDFAGARNFADRQIDRQAQRMREAARAKAWTWPRIRRAAYKRRRWLLIPLSLFVGLVAMIIARRIARNATP